MKKKALCLFVASLTALAATACGGETVTGGELRVYNLLPSEKYVRDYEVSKTPDASMTFAGMKNETQSAQLMFNADYKVTSFDLDGADFVLEGGTAKIEASNVDIYAERCTEVYAPYYQSEQYLSSSGWYPDALIPIDRYQLRKEDKVEAKENQAIWVDVFVPETATAGTYKSTFTLTVNGKETAIPVTMTVYDIVLPEEVHNPTAFDIWYQNISAGEGNNFDDGTYERYFEYLWTKRLNCETLPPAYSKEVNAGYLEYITELAVNPKCTSYRIPCTRFANEEWKVLVAPKVPSDRAEAEKRAAMLSVQNELTKQLTTILEYNLALREQAGKEDIDLLKKAFYYYEDEPPIGSYRMQSVRIFCEVLNNAKKEVAQAFATELAENADLAASLDNVDEICPSLYMSERSGEAGDLNNYGGGLIMSNEEVSDGLSFWCPEMYQFNKADFRETVAERIALGEKVWWYLCVSNTPRPSYYVESLPVNIRMQQWMQYDYGVQGILYWDVAHFASDRDNYDDLQYHEYGSGEGILLYPGARYGMKQPISSWRLENIRLGQQDYEIFYMLDEAMKATDGITATAQDLVEKLGAGLYSGSTVHEETTSESLEAARLKLLKLLQHFEKDEIDSAKAMINDIMK